MTFSIVTLKAFGDFVIACGSARAVQAGANRPQVVAGEYVRPLAAALGVESEVRFIGTQHGAPWTDVPAVFDVRKRGLPAAVRSLFELRAILGQLPPAWNLVFDHAGPRERLLCSHHPFHSLSKETGNVYLAYRQFFTQQRLTVTPHTIARQFVPYNALLVPGARMRLFGRGIMTFRRQAVSRKFWRSCCSTRLDRSPQAMWRSPKAAA